MIELRDGDFSDFLIPIFQRFKRFDGKKAKAMKKLNKRYAPPEYVWTDESGTHEDFPVKWLPPKLKTMVKKYCAEHSSKPDDDNSSEDSGSEMNDAGVFLLILENENSPNKCQVYRVVSAYVFNDCQTKNTQSLQMNKI